jgi:aromatic-L-amino-acid/L-tryptophan decarboxylase
MTGWDGDIDVARLLQEAAGLAAAIVDGAAAGSVTRPLPADLLDALRAESAPVTGRPIAEVLARVRDDVAPYPMGNGHPRFVAWVNSPPHPVGVAGALLAAASNPSVAGGRHAAVHVEHAVVRWFLDLLGWHASSAGGEAFGLFVSGGSAATTTALAAARHCAYGRAGWDDRENGLTNAPEPVVFATVEAHSCLTKAVELLGIGSGQIERIACDAEYRMDPRDITAKLRAAAAAGRVPVAVVASVGTVNTGAIDPLDEIADICRDHGVWLHVDGAYGGPAVLLLGRFTSDRAALARADSVALDPHKWLYTPVDAGLVLFRDGDTARSTFSLVPSYLAVDHADDEPPWFAEYGSEQTRPFRALKLWMQLQYLGLDGYRNLISRDLDTANALRAAVGQAPDFELLASGLSVVCFRHRPAGLGEQDLNTHNRNLAERLQRDGRAFLAATTVDGRAALRACIVDPRTDPSDVDAVLTAIQDLADPGPQGH